ncbi:MAG: hypothetical protein ACK55Z_18470, partial [bacterium]
IRWQLPDWFKSDYQWARWRHDLLFLVSRQERAWMGPLFECLIHLDDNQTRQDPKFGIKDS